MMREGPQDDTADLLMHSLAAPFVLDGNAIRVEDTLDMLHLSDLEMADLEDQQQCLESESSAAVAVTIAQERRHIGGGGQSNGKLRHVGDEDAADVSKSPFLPCKEDGSGEPGTSSRDATMDGELEELEACGPDPGGGTGVFRRVAVRILPLFFTIAMLCQVDRTNLSFAQLQLQEDLNFHEAVYGTGAGLFFIGYALFQLPSNLLCVWLGAPLWLTIIVTTWGGVATLFATMSSKAQFYIQRVILGIAESGAYPAMFYHMTQFFDAWELGVGYSITASATASAGLLGGWLAAGFLCMDGVLGLHGWQWLFLMEGIPTILIGLSIKVILLKDIASAKFLAVDERLWLLQRQQKSLHQKLKGSRKANTTTAALYDWRVWYLGAAWFLMAGAMDGLVFWGPRLVKNAIMGSMSEDTTEVATARCGAFEAGAGAAKVSILTSGPSFCAAVAMILVAFTSKRYSERHIHAALPIGLATLALGLMPMLVNLNFWAGYVMIIIAYMGVWGPHGPLMSWPALFLHGSAASTGFALIKTLGAFGSAAGAYLIGLVAEETEDFSNAMYLLASFTGVCTLMLAFFPEPGNVPHKKILARLFKQGSDSPRRFKFPSLFRRNTELSAPLHELQMEPLPLSITQPGSPPSAALNGALLSPNIHHHTPPRSTALHSWITGLRQSFSRSDSTAVGHNAPSRSGSWRPGGRPGAEDGTMDLIANGHVRLASSNGPPSLEGAPREASWVTNLSNTLRGVLRGGRRRPGSDDQSLNKMPLRESES